MQSILDLLNDGNEQATQRALLNVHATPFVPRAVAHGEPTSSDHVESEDDSPPEQWPVGNEAGEWYNHSSAQWTPRHGYNYEQAWPVVDPNANQWMHPHAQYQSAGVDVDYWWQQQTIMEQTLYQPPQMPKGNTYARARSQQARWR